MKGQFTRNENVIINMGLNAALPQFDALINIIPRKPLRITVV